MEQFNYYLEELRISYIMNAKRLEQKLVSQHHLLIDHEINSFKGVFLVSNEIIQK